MVTYRFRDWEKYAWIVEYKLAACRRMQQI